MNLDPTVRIGACNPLNAGFFDLRSVHPSEIDERGTLAPGQLLPAGSRPRLLQEPNQGGPAMTRQIWIPPLPQFRTRRSRRLMVCLLAAVAAVLFPTEGWYFVMFPYFLLTRSGNPPMDGGAPVDERQWRVRAEATIIAHRILVVIAAGLVVWETLHPPVARMRLGAVMVFIICLPAAIQAWREPDAPPAIPQDQA